MKKIHTKQTLIHAQIKDMKLWLQLTTQGPKARAAPGLEERKSSPVRRTRALGLERSDTCFGILVLLT